MVSNIDPTQPKTGIDQPVKVIRDNFVAAHDEITTLQNETSLLGAEKLDRNGGLATGPIKFHRVTSAELTSNVHPPATNRGGLLFVGPSGTPTGSLYYSNGTEWRQLLDETFMPTGGGGTTEDVFTAIRGDTGVISATSYSEVEIIGGSGINTSVTDNILTITNTQPNVDQDIFKIVQGDTGSRTAQTTSDTLRIIGGTDISTQIIGDDLIINFTGSTTTLNGLNDVNTAGAVNGSVLKYQGGFWIVGTDNNTLQNLYHSVAGDIGNSFAATPTDVLTFAGGTDISTTVSGNTITINYDGAAEENQNAFSSVTNGSNTLSATTKTDELVFFGGSDISITVDTINNRLQFDYTGTTSLADLTDVDLTGLVQDSILRYNAISMQWEISVSSPGTQNIFETFAGNVGSATPSSPTDTLNIVGGTGITTSVTGNTLTITNSQPNINQNIWATFNADTGTTTANSITDTFTFVGGTGITADIVGDTLVISNTLPNTSQALWATIDSDSGSTTANTSTDTLTVTGTNGISTSIVGDTLTIDFSGSPSATNLSNLNDVVISTPGIDQVLRFDGVNWINADDLPNWANIVADTGSTMANTVGDTLTISGGLGITTEIVGDTLTITNDYPDQSVFVTITANSGVATAGSSLDNLDILGGTGISTSITGNTLTITNTSPNIVQNIFRTIASSSGVRTASSASDTMTFIGTNGISTSISGSILTINNSYTTLNSLNDVDAGMPNLNDILKWNGSVWTTAPDSDAQNLWLTIQSDSGSISADNPNDILMILGGTGIDTAIVGDTLTITNTSPNIVQNVFVTVSADVGMIPASTPTSSYTIAGGTGISTSVSGSVLTVTNDSPNIEQNVFTTLISDSGITMADSTTDSLSVFGGTGISTQIVGDTLTITNTATKFNRMVADTGSYNAPTSATEFTINGGIGITTSITAGVMTITNDALVFSNVAADMGVATADDISDTLTIQGGTNVTTSVSTGNTLVIDIDADITVDTVTATTVTADTFTSSGTGIQTIQSATDIVLDAPDSVRIAQSPFRLASFTTAERDNLTPSNGDMIYNTTLHRFQGYANGSWVDLSM